MNLNWMPCVLLALCAQKLQGLSVEFGRPLPFRVALGRELVLQSITKKLPTEDILMVTWEYNGDTGMRRLATIPGKIQDYRISMEDGGTTLRLSDIQESDFGRYIITVTGLDGTQSSAYKDVRKSDRPPEASVVLLCDVSPEGAQWDSPVVTWLVDGVKVTNQTAHTSEGGSKLHLQELKGRNYTCISNSSLGTSVAHFILPDSAVSGNPCAVCVCSSNIIVALLAVLCWQ
ncbi:hypothetical protein ACEWY4_019570 [Coilia grayii]|uniref:Ig-like domain-containing protein n=1 Tax=Coilia grayii TaxID=363190 RepID=A0ABD1JA32_9TELE